MVLFWHFMFCRSLILPHVVGAQFTSFLIPATLAGRAEDHKAGRKYWGMEGRKDMEWRGVCASDGLAVLDTWQETGSMGRKERDREEENPKPKKRQMLHSQQCSTSNTNTCEGWWYEGRVGGTAVGKERMYSVRAASTELWSIIREALMLSFFLHFLTKLHK